MNESIISPLLSTPSLYIVATPLGNLRDLSPRARDTLAAVDAIAAEDTRHSQKLLDAFGIRPRRLLAVHQHNEQQAAGQIIERLARGEHVALITDAGTPAISDPGARLVERVREAGYAVSPVPGACAAIAALSVAGIAEGGFRFIGFLPAKTQSRRTALTALADEHNTMVFYETPHRIKACTADMAEVFGGGREIIIARELTKLHEEIAVIPLNEAEAWFAADANRLRGEFVLIVRGAEMPNGIDADALRILGLLLDELPLKTAVRLAAEITGVSRKGLYAHALKQHQ
ncbi:MAG: 16S rRNA (cytidine(1402)-2'-O)-methyltransferase [Azoarcus sp.]|jgi:16S rRNA (cytidine1402-2'-O)-methyltransferase|nr:16S rRNA (cytidine(1402)-2'-O)-methyltransferase [Azoarcus sp.]